MKTCPACGTQYEEHVPQCFVDGTSLGEVESDAIVSSDAAPPPPPVESAEAEESGNNNRLLILLLLGGVVLLGLLGVIAVLLMGASTVGSSDPPPPPEPIEQPAPEPPPKPTEPAPEPAPEPTISKIGVTSTPEGATVWEGATELCTTPCSIDHPEHAPLPRNVVLKAAGYKDSTYAIDNAERPHHVSLKRIRTTRPRPVTPRPPPTRPAPGPKPPDIQMER